MSFKQIARDAANREANTGEDSIGLIVRNAASNTKNKTKGLSKINLPSFDEGGTVPGDEGQPKLIVAHGQEEVLPTEEAEQYRALKPLGLNTEKQSGGIGRIEMDPNSTQPATISTQELGITKPKELISTEEKEEKPEATGGTVIADRWLKRNGLAAPTDSAIPQGVTAPKGLNQGGPGLKPIVLPDITTTAPAATEAIPTGRAAYKSKIADYDKQYQDLMDKAATDNDPALREQAARVREAKLAYQQAHSWGSPESAHPGVLGRIGHIGEEIASRAPFGISTISATIPGSEGYRAAQARGAEGQLEKITPEVTARRAEEKKEPVTKEWQEISGGAIDPKHPELGAQPAFYNKNNPDEGIRFGNVPLAPKAGAEKNAPATADQVADYQQRIANSGLTGKALEVYGTAPKNATTAELDKRFDEATKLRGMDAADQRNKIDEQAREDAAAEHKLEHEDTEKRKGTAENIAARKEVAKIYADPLTSAERYDIMTKNLFDALPASQGGKNDQQAMLSLLANHLGMTMGLQKGARLNQAIIDEAAKSQPWISKIGAKFDKDGYLSGLTLSPEQMKSMVNLARERYSEDVSKARNVAKYAGAEDDGPDRTPSTSTMHYYLGLAGGDVAKAKQLAGEDGWTVPQVK